MDQLSIILAAILVAVALVHVIWALGGTWPCRDEQSLARTVVGSRGIERMPPRWASAVLGLCLFVAAAWALALRGHLPYAPPRSIILLGGTALAYFFVIRGAVGVLPAFEKRAPEQPFVRLNRIAYSPFCVAVGVAFGLLVIAWPDWKWRLGLLFKMLSQ